MNSMKNAHAKAVVADAWRIQQLRQEAALAAANKQQDEHKKRRKRKDSQRSIRTPKFQSDIDVAETARGKQWTTSCNLI